MHFKLSRASSNFAPSVRHPASVLAFILNLYARDRQSEDIVLGRDLDSVRHVIADGLVVFHPGCSQASQFHFSSARKDCIFSSYEQKKKIRRISENFSLVFLRSQSWPWTCLVKAKAMMMMFQSFALFLGSLEKETRKENCHSFDFFVRKIRFVANQNDNGKIFPGDLPFTEQCFSFHFLRILAHSNDSIRHLHS